MIKKKKNISRTKSPAERKWIQLSGTFIHTGVNLDARMYCCVVMSLVVAVCMMTIPSVSGGWIDADTPPDKRTAISLIDGTTYHLVMSDEFNVPNRTFTDGHDPIWTALDKSDDDASAAGGGSLHFYNSSTVTTTNDGMLKISSILSKTEWDHYDQVNKEYKHVTKYFKSGMVQTWNKFCFTGGIVEVDVIFPGDPFIGGLWPAVWMLGNLGRATYEASTNNIWPWSYDKCDRKLQDAQTISACNRQNHYGLNPYQGRGATEIDLVEVMAGDSGGPLPSTKPPVSIPYGDMTLQIAPGVPDNRPQSGGQPRRHDMLSESGHTELLAQTWYDGLEFQGNTSLNPFFYGTYLGVTKPEEPVTRNKHQVFQADAIGALHQLTPAHFEKVHTFRIEWQPGPGGRLDWFSKGHKINETFFMEGDGLGQDWVHAFSIKDKSIHDLMASQIPNEPTYLIINTAISSTWGFPYDVPDWCNKCYDCDDPKCACAFSPGFCKMMKQGDVAMYIDSVRVYQSHNESAHVGNNHTLGCDPPEYPTTEWIKGHEYRYMRNPPFSYHDKGPLKDIQRGGGLCDSDRDCGGDVVAHAAVEDNNTPKSEEEPVGVNKVEVNGSLTPDASNFGRGKCVSNNKQQGLFGAPILYKMCRCNEGYTGPRCLALDHKDQSISAHKLREGESLFDSVHMLRVTPFMATVILLMTAILIAITLRRVFQERSSVSIYEFEATPLASRGKLKRPQFRASDKSNLIITGRSV